MSTRTTGPQDGAEDAALAAAVFALAPASVGGVRLRAPPGPVRDAWLELVADLLPEGRRLRRVPVNVGTARLLGGLDLAATLRSGQPHMQRGLLAEADGDALVLSMAERVLADTAAQIGAALDNGSVRLERDGFGATHLARFGLIALDEGLDHEEAPPEALLDRLAIHLDLKAVALGDIVGWCVDPYEVREASALVGRVAAGPEVLESLCAAALGLGIPSLRAPLAALRVARASAALSGRAKIAEEDLVAAARLVLSPRARTLPVEEAPTEADSEGEEEADLDGTPERGDEIHETTENAGEQGLNERVLDAARASLPADLLARLALGGGQLRRSGPVGKSGVGRQSMLRGRPAGVRRGEPRRGARVNVLETLRAAAPWQRLRGRAPADVPAANGPNPVRVRREDFRVTRFRQRALTTTIFAVDASGSSALHRLAEAKGAVELLLAECYVRRDRVALIAFRGAGADLLLPPTRSLARAKRCLAALPGGGGTPLAAGIDAARSLSEGVIRGGGTAVVVLLTDGRANVGRDGIGGRQRARSDAEAAARGLAGCGAVSLVLDTSPRPQAAARGLAEAMTARYLPLPHADATVLNQAVRATVDAVGQGSARV